MKQRVAIARVYANRPQVLLMDEPFGSLDAQTRTIMQEDLSEVFMTEKKTVVFITHSVDEAIYLGDRPVPARGTSRAAAANPGTSRPVDSHPADSPDPDLRRGQDRLSGG